jgi:hypothetical protein
MTLIEDGKGTGQKARVDGNFRLHTEAVTESEGVHAVEKGDAYNINTGNISFSAAGTLLYLVNNEDKDLVIEAIAVGAGTGTVSDIGEITVERNITGGEVISDATAVSMNQNRNFGSNKTLSATVYKGKSGGTSTGGDDIILFYHGTSGRLFATINLVIPKGSNVSITYDPKLSSGSIKAYCAIVCHLKDPESGD